MKRKLDDDRLREVVRARLTKGAAFMRTGEDYQTEQQRVQEHLARMSRETIFRLYPHHTYDIKL